MKTITTCISDDVFNLKHICTMLTAILVATNTYILNEHDKEISQSCVWEIMSCFLNHTSLVFNTFMHNYMPTGSNESKE